MLHITGHVGHHAARVGRLAAVGVPRLRLHLRLDRRLRRSLLRRAQVAREIVMLNVNNILNVHVGIV